MTAFLLSALTCGCSHQEEPLLPQGSGTLSLQLHRVGCMTETRAVSSELAVTIVGTDGPVATFAPGQVPDKIKLEPGNYELFAYTDNQETWEQDNEGRGSACHWGTTAFTITYSGLTAIIGMWGVSMSMIGFCQNLLSLPQRIAFLVGGVCMIIPGTITDGVGIALIIATFFWQKTNKVKGAIQQTEDL